MRLCYLPQAQDYVVNSVRSIYLVLVVSCFALHIQVFDSWIDYCTAAAAEDIDVPRNLADTLPVRAFLKEFPIEFPRGSPKVFSRGFSVNFLGDLPRTFSGVSYNSEFLREFSCELKLYEYSVR